MGAFVPQCDRNGGYMSVQCQGSTGYCWCVDTAGTEIDGTRMAPGGRNQISAATCDQSRLTACNDDDDMVMSLQGPGGMTCVQLMQEGVCEQVAAQGAQIGNPGMCGCSCPPQPPPPATFRLSSGDEFSGLLEASTNNGRTWGPVCDDTFEEDDNALEVVCRELGFKVKGRFTGSQCDSFTCSRNFALDEVTCPDPSAKSVTEGCTYQVYTDCRSDEGVWINCKSPRCDAPPPPPGRAGGGGFGGGGGGRRALMRGGLRPPPPPPDWCDPVQIGAISLVDESGNHVQTGRGVRTASGILMAVVDGQNGFVCDDTFEDTPIAAQVACKQLGFTDGVACDVTITQAMSEGSGGDFYSLDDVECTDSSATSLSQCTAVGQADSDCALQEAVMLMCGAGQTCPPPPPSAGEGRNRCRYENDGECDVPQFCAEGTDTADCGSTGGQTTETCPYEGDGECDVPRLCPVGTDEVDCGGSEQSCQWQGDGECDVPQLCPVGTDAADCESAGDACQYKGDGECDVPTYCPQGSDVADCGAGETTGTCPYESDGECDVPTFCPEGTDQADCRATGGGGTTGGSSNPACWSGAYTEQRCCGGGGRGAGRGGSTGGDASCWSGQFNYQFCCGGH